MTRYKLTDQHMRAYGLYQWTLGEWHEATGDGTILCSDGYLHVYTDPLLAVFLNPIYGYVKTPRLFECECDGDCLDSHGLKQGYKRVRLTRELPVPVVTTEQRVRFGILCALKCPTSDEFRTWAENWLNGQDRTEASAIAAAKAARAAAWAAKDAAWCRNIDLIALAKQAVEGQ